MNTGLVPWICRCGHVVDEHGEGGCANIIDAGFGPDVCVCEVSFD